MPDEIDIEYHRKMNDLAYDLDRFLNSPDPSKPTSLVKNRTVGFALLVFDLHKKSTNINYISNAKRGDMINAVELWLKRAKAEE